MAYKELKQTVDKLLSNLVEQSMLKLSSMDLKSDLQDSQLLGDLKDFNKTLKNIERGNIRKFNNRFYFERKIFELLILEHSSLWLLLTETFWGEKKKLGLKEEDVNRICHVCIIMNNQINALKSVLILLERGLTHVASTIFRNYIELSEKAIAILTDQEYYEVYKKECKDITERKRKWNRIKPASTFKIVKKKLVQLHGIDSEIFFDVRNNLYAKTSEATHGDVSSNLPEAFFNHEDMNQSSWSAGGKITKRIKELFKDYLVYTRIIHRAFMVMLVADFNIHLSKFGKDGIYHGLIYQVSDQAFQVLLELYIDSED